MSGQTVLDGPHTTGAAGVGSVLSEAPDTSGDPIPRDHNDWPIVPHPYRPGETLKCRRPSQIGKRLMTDTFAVDRWRARSIAVGAGRNRALAELAAPLDPKRNRAELDDIAEAMLVAGGGKDAANRGTARHKWLELMLSGDPVPDGMDDVTARDMAAIGRVLDEHGMMPVEGMLEQFVICPEIPAAGSLDAATTLWAFAGNLVTDLKTSQTDPREYNNGLEIAMQLACYARASHTWAGRVGGVVAPVEPIGVDLNLDVGLVIWAPAESGHAELIPVDLEAGWRAIEVGLQVAAMRTNRRQFFVELPERPVLEQRKHDGFSTATVAQRVVACRRRFRSLVDGADVSLDDVAAGWPVDVNGERLPSLRHGSAYDDARIEAVEAFLHDLEAAHKWTPAVDGRLLADHIDGLPADLKGVLEVQAELEGVPNVLGRSLKTAHSEWLWGAIEALETARRNRGERVVRALSGLDDAVAADIVLQASAGTVSVVADLDDVGCEVAIALASIEKALEGGVEAALSEDELVQLAGSKSELIAVAKTIVDDRQLGKRPRSAKAVVDDRRLAALSWLRLIAAHDDRAEDSTAVQTAILCTRGAGCVTVSIDDLDEAAAGDEEE